MKRPAAAHRLAALCACAACLVAAPAAAQTRAPVVATNVSTGDSDTSRTPESAQTRWVEDGRHAGVFLAGGATPESLRTGASPSPHGLVVVVTEFAPGSVRAIAGSPEAVRAAAWTEPLLRRAERRFRRLDGFDDDASHPAASPGVDLRAPAAPKGLPGSVMSGSPARSEDSGARVLQASWRQGNLLEGRFGRGDWRGGELSTVQPGAWLVVFDHDETTGRTRMLALSGSPGAGPARYTVDGREAPLTPEVLRWAADVLERTPAPWDALHE